MKTLNTKAILDSICNTIDTVHKKAPIIAKTNAKLRSSGIGQVTLHFGKLFYVPHIWSVASSKPVMELPVQQITDINAPKTLSFAINKHNVPHVDTSYPIVIDQNGLILDGRHRWTQARNANVSHIKVQQVHTDELPDVTKIVVGVATVVYASAFIAGVYTRKALVKRLLSK